MALLPRLLVPALALALVPTAALAGTAWDFGVCSVREQNWFGEREGKRQHWIETNTSCRNGTAKVDGERILVEWNCCGAAADAPMPEGYRAVSTDGGATFVHLDDETETWWSERVDRCPSRRAWLGLVGGSVRVKSMTLSPDPVPVASSAPYAAEVVLESRVRFGISFRRVFDWRVRVERSARSFPRAEGVLRLLDDDALFRCTDLLIGNVRRVVAESESEAPKAERPLLARVVIELANARPWDPEPETFVIPGDWDEVEEPEER